MREKQELKVINRKRKARLERIMILAACVVLVLILVAMRLAINT
jgi:t-SNARE complex subunit (syntaxin)